MFSMAVANLGGAPYLQRISTCSTWLAVSYALTKSTKPTYEARPWLCLALSRDFNVKRPSRHPISGVPPNWNRVPCLSSSEKARAVIPDEKTLLHMSIHMIPHHLLGLLRLPCFGTGILWLWCHSLLSTLPSKKSQTWWCTVHCETLSIALSASGGMPLRPGAFPFFSLFMAHLTSANLIGL